jgi:hypothetical protein
MFEEAFKKKVVVAWKQVQPAQQQANEQPAKIIQETAPAAVENLNPTDENLKPQQPEH